MRSRLRLFPFQLSLLWSLCLATDLAAHHSQSAYDLSRQTVIRGSVTAYEWANPHVYIYLKDAGGTTWEVEGSATSLMRRLGWSRDTLAVGEQVTVTGNPGRDPGRHINIAITLEKQDGTLLYARNSPALTQGVDPARFRADTLTGTWLTLLQPELAQDFLMPERMPLTDKALAALAAYEPGRNPSNDCTPFTSPLHSIFPAIKQITVEADRVLLKTDFQDIERVIHLDTASHAGVPRTLQGHSIGSWNGGVLEVDTTRFTAHPNGITIILPSSEDKHLVESFELSDDGASLDYHFELEDPVYLSAPLVGDLVWAYRPDLMAEDEPCDLDVARRYLDD